MSSELNFDGLIGPSHNYGGLSHGNVASTGNESRVSQPKLAALQGLEKMDYMRKLGLTQGVLLPHQRPHLPSLRGLGFSGSDSSIINKVSNKAPQLLVQCYSASSMWAANSCTVSPSADSADGKVHFTAANLSSMFHRSIEHQTTSLLLKNIFSDEAFFSHHSALPAANALGDEGAANHNRFANEYAAKGVQLFVYGRSAFNATESASVKFPLRQTYEASSAISRLHQLSSKNTVFAQQSPVIVDAGAFHNDVVAVSNLNTFFMHEQAFINKAEMQSELADKFDGDLHFIEVATEQVSLEAAVKSYLFNSQLVQLPNDEGMALVLPEESRDNAQVYEYLQSLEQQSTPIKHIKFVNVRQSMQNGGGPACLRLRVALNDQEIAAVNPRFLLNDSLLRRLKKWVNTHYREFISPDDLRDPSLAIENFTALDELTQIFKLGSFYEFQK